MLDHLNTIVEKEFSKAGYVPTFEATWCSGYAMATPSVE